MIQNCCYTNYRSIMDLPVLKRQQSSRAYSVLLPAIGGPMMAAIPRAIDSRPKAFVSLPRPNRSQIIIEVSEINGAEMQWLNDYR